ncbi:hypothetical protein ACHAXS_001252 [Conticribra weissflogii]
MADASPNDYDYDYDLDDESDGVGHLSIDEIQARRTEELEALRAYYGNDLTSSLSSEASPFTEADDVAVVEGMPVAGPWFLRIRHQPVDFATEGDPSSDNHGGRNRGDDRGLGIPTLEIRLPKSYPLGNTAPTPVLHNVMMNPDKKRQLLKELVEMYEVDVEVSILWGERCREELLQSDDPSDILLCNERDAEYNNNDEIGFLDDDEHDADNFHDNFHDDNHHTSVSGNNNDDNNNNNDDCSENKNDTTTYIPPTTKFNQPIRTFPTHVVNNPLHQRTIIRTRPFHPPKSGPGETMIGHAARVTSVEHVQWVLARLLFHDKKVAKANHNMFAYRFTTMEERRRRVADNDDDGEKGSGAKLAALLEMCKVDDVIVVVSRWFGGIHLGPARFKYIAGVGRDALVEGGFLKE